MGPEVIGDEAWETLFSSGPLTENPDIRMSIVRRWTLNVRLQSEDQLGMMRPANLLGDVGAIELP